MLYLAVAVRAFRRYSTYGWATLAGVFTNSVFGVIASFVYLAVWDENPTAGGYDAVDAVTYAWIGQAVLAMLMVFGGGSPGELAERVRTGDVSLDFYRPVGILGWYLAADLGRAAYHLLTRGFAPLLVGALLFELRWPATPLGWATVAVSLLLAVVVSFGLRFLVALSAFWLLDDTGVNQLLMVATLFFTGLTVPLVLFPGALLELVMGLPWAAYLQVPADIWLGQRSGGEVWSGLAFQAAWAAALLGTAWLALRLAERRVVVQGG